jgi:MFS family permease
MRAKFGELWHHPDFLRLWSAQAISLFGSAFTTLALPLTAVLVLGATPLQMGILGALSGAPWLLVGPFAGVFVDRMRRRPLLIGADLVRALLIGSIPLAAALGRLHLSHLYLVAFPIGIASVLFDIAHQSYLPSLVTRARLLEGNSKLSASLTLTNVATPGIAGWIIQIASAPFALLIDALSFLLSACCLFAIRTPEATPTMAKRWSEVRDDMREGLWFAFKNPYIRDFLTTNVVFFFFNGTINSVLLLYFARNLGLPPSTIGLILAVGSIGGVVGTLFASPLARRWGTGTIILWSAIFRGTATIALPLVGSMPIAGIPLLVAAQFLVSMNWSIYFINQTSTRQALVPDRLLGRVNASFWVVIRGSVPFGTMLGGLLGTQFGTQCALLVGAIGALCSGLLLLRSPVVALREPPLSPSEEVVASGT